MRNTMISVLAVASLALVSGCGSSGGSDDESEKATTTSSASTTTTVPAVPVAEWTISFCADFETWNDTIIAASAATDDQVKPGDVESGKTALTGLFGTASEATQTLMTAIDEGGMPDIDDGDKLIDDLSGTFQTFLDAAQTANSDAQALATDDAATFQTAKDELASQFQDDINAVRDDFSAMDSKYDDPELTSAIEAHCG